MKWFTPRHPKFTPICFIPFSTIINGIIFLFSLLGIHYKCMEIYWFLYVELIFCSIVELLFSSVSLFRRGLLEIVYVQNHIICKKRQFTFSFRSWLPFLPSSFYVTALARRVSTALDRSGESGHPCPVLYFRGKASCSSALNIMFSVGTVLIFACQVSSVVSSSLWPHGP